jgi:hypothetical protein
LEEEGKKVRILQVLEERAMERIVTCELQKAKEFFVVFIRGNEN